MSFALASLSLNALSTEELIARVEATQHKLEGLKLERDDLQRDVELLCMQSGSATFNSSSLLQERLFSVESELARLRTHCQRIELERVELREDHVALRQAKRQSDNSHREVRRAQLRSRGRGGPQRRPGARVPPRAPWHCCGSGSEPGARGATICTVCLTPAHAGARQERQAGAQPGVLPGAERDGDAGSRSRDDGRRVLA